MTGVLVVCTANRCRSPLAAALLAREAARRGADLQVTSAGLLPGGHPVPPDGVRIAAELGLDLTGHRSRTVTADDLAAADLVLTMTRDHARTLVADHPDVWPRIFPIRWLPQWLAAQLAAGPPPRRATLRSWIDAAASERDRRDLLGNPPEFEVVDPFGQPPRIWSQVAHELSTTASAIVDRCLPLLARGTAPPRPR